MKYRIGLDIGIASVGWCALETDENGEPTKIIELGVRVFDACENPKDGSSLASPRRKQRGLRRLVRRRRHRVERVEALLAREFGDGAIALKKFDAPLDLLQARVKGLDFALSKEELSRVCLYFVKHRGFRSSRKAGKASKDEGKLLSATKSNNEALSKGEYRSVGEMLLTDKRFVCREVKADGTEVVSYKYRNKGGCYSNTFLRSDLEREIKRILEKQVECGVVKQPFVDKYLEIFNSQRSFDEGPGDGSPYSGTFAVGACAFESGEERAPKAAFTAEYAHALERLNNLRVTDLGTELPLTEEQRETLIEKIKSGKAASITFAQLRKFLGYDGNDGVRFNLLRYSAKKSVEETEKATFVSMANSREIRKALSAEHACDCALVDEIACVIGKNKSLDRQSAALNALNVGLSDKEIAAIGTIYCTKYAHLSLKALRKILPFLEKGDKYSEACAKAGYNHSEVQVDRLKLLKGEEINSIISDIGSPVVRRSFSQTLKVINALVLKYGSPIGVNIELARDLSKTKEERDKIDKSNKNRHSENEKILERIKNEYGILAPKGHDIIKLRLYEEQGGKCAYSGEVLDASRLFEGKYVEVDHILPYSRSFDDSYDNKALVRCGENQNKGNRTPYEYFGSDEKRWRDFVARVMTFGCCSEKKNNLLRKQFGGNDEREWKSRNLNDTRYVSRLAYNIINDYLLLEPSKVERHMRVRAVKGGITAYVRKMWGLAKIREDGDKHHALDAAVIATITPSMERKITEYNKRKETCFMRTCDDKFVDSDGVVYTFEAYKEKFGVRLAPPYPSFVDELSIRMLDECEEVDLAGTVHKGIRQVQLQRLAEMGYDEASLVAIKPIFVSRMPKRKAKGALHKESVYSAKYIESDGIIVIREELIDLKLDNSGEIKDYWEKARISDPLLYDALKQRLKAYGGDGKKAFAEPFYKPKSDGSNGAVVRTVKIAEKSSVGMVKKNGYVKNEDMVRVDVFYKKGKYYYVPVYAKDIARGVIPSRAVFQGKSYDEWPVIDESFTFLFALHKNDLMYIKAKKPINMKNERTKKELQKSEGYFYYRGFDSSSGNISLCMHDDSYGGRVGGKTLQLFKKFDVDILGGITEVKSEKRELTGITKKR